MYLIKDWLIYATRFLTLLICSICVIACADKTPVKITAKNIVNETVVPINTTVTDTFEAGKIIENVSCQDDAGQSYSLYIPVRSQKEILPVIYFFDPHGNGTLPLSKYRSLADTYDFILVGSNNSKNGNDWSATEKIWGALSGDTQKRLKINKNRIYTCGFSGGAKVAGYVALHHNEVKAVIANGAGLQDDIQATGFNFSFTAIAGEGDMNMTDLVTFNSDLDKTRTRHRIVFFDGIHEWAPENTMDIAFEGLQLDAMYGKLIPKDNGLINSYINESKKRLEKYLIQNSLVKAEREYKLSISMLDGVSGDVTWFKEKDILITRNPAYKKQWQIQQDQLNTEQNLKAGYNQQFQQGDINYWSQTIKDLRAKTRSRNAEAAIYQRLLAYLSLAFYSISNRFIMGNQNGEALYFDNLYKLADPINSEAWYFSAIINARNNKVKETEDDLLKAVDLGFMDVTRMIRQPDFLKLSPQINFAKIENYIKLKR